MKNLDKYGEYGPLVLRWCLGLFFIAVGYFKFAKPEMFTELVRAGVPFLNNYGLFLLIDGTIGIIIGIFLLFGLWTRFMGLLTTIESLLILTLFYTAFNLVFTTTGGLTNLGLLLLSHVVVLGAGLNLFFSGSWIYSVDRLLRDFKHQ